MESSTGHKFLASGSFNRPSQALSFFVFGAWFMEIFDYDNSLLLPRKYWGI